MKSVFTTGGSFGTGQCVHCRSVKVILDRCRDVCLGCGDITGNEQRAFRSLRRLFRGYDVTKGENVAHRY